MSLLGPNGDELKGAVMMGGRRLTLTISQEGYDIMRMLAPAVGMGPSELATNLLEDAIRTTWQRYLRERFVFQLVNWVNWP